ncbi:restriction system-associated AAA family ATPase [Flavobacterium saccharophilum]|uniref:Restriction system-associated AAA family ATPase n=1 Tax=Flavobacterium saccharophilum TaxID=29534 RepID=A0A1M7FM34_9FLAO|nr:restriction system-associated AAA family ATPase [Flavobacterium saccharophilum]SHM04749.1 restriction system-associated AAA family ATPase [Flavobacterium saccharophilum]
MKLIKLKIKDNFRGLKDDFEINFHDYNNGNLAEFHPFCLAGQNGSGKSNILEALANIFYHLECCTSNFPKYAFLRHESTPDVYEIEYLISNVNSVIIDDLSHIKISKNQGFAPKMSINSAESIEVTKDYGKSFLPDLVVAYSSGENETLSLPFIKTKLFQYDQYLQDFVKNSIYDKPKSSLLFIDYEMSQAVLLTILLFFDFEIDGKKSVLFPLDEELGIKGIQQFTINLNNKWQKTVSNYEGELEMETVNDEYYLNDKEKKNYKGRILDHISEQLKKIEDCATCTFKNEDFTSLDFWINDCTKKLIRQKFKNNPYDFFSIFQMLHALNERVEKNSEKVEVYNSKGYYTDYKKPEYNWFFNFSNYFIKQYDMKTEKIKSLLLKQLSDGEQQFLHTLGICLMLKNKRTLLLLDEPETHFNPNWRSKFIYILRKTLEAGGENFLSKDIIITSHSPFIISDCLPDKVIIFEKGKKPENAKFNTFGTSIDIITEEIFKNTQTIGDYSKSKLQNIEFSNIKSEIDVLNAKKSISTLGDSLEKDLTLLRLNKLKF